MHKGYILVLLILVMTFSAAAQGKKPVITGQKPLSTNENQALTLKLTDLEVSDPDTWFYPWGFSLTIHKGDHYKFTDQTFTPEKGFTGMLSVKVTVNDGKNNSDPYMVQVDVLPVNDRPVINGQVSVQTTMNTSIEILLTHLTVTDSDNTYPTDFTLQVYPGSNYSINGSTITPSANFKGTLTVNVSVKDGTATSESYPLKVVVSDV
jgi:hypothetical protein